MSAVTNAAELLRLIDHLDDTQKKMIGERAGHPTASRDGTSVSYSIILSGRALSVSKYGVKKIGERSMPLPLASSSRAANNPFQIRMPVCLHGSASLPALSIALQRVAALPED